MTTNFFGRQAGRHRNQLDQSCSELLGMAEGLLADKVLSDDEIKFLDRWLSRNDVVAAEWPGDVLHARVKEAMADGVITEDERAHLVITLKQLMGGKLDDLATIPKINTLALDENATVVFQDHAYCLTGDFVFGPRPKCQEMVRSRGGIIKSSVSRQLDYLVIGGLGSDEWKHGSFGLKIAKAIELKRAGSPIFIVHEDVWANAL